MHLSTKGISLADTTLRPRSFERTLPSQGWLEEHQDDYVIRLQLVQLLDHISIQCVSRLCSLVRLSARE